MQGQKSHSFKLFLWKNIFVVGAFFFASFLNLNFNSNEVSALFVPTLSASVDQANLQVNGNQVINSTNKTTEIPLNLTVNTNNRTGYTATLNSETDETALVNNDSMNGAKINSISSAGPLGDFSNNTWGYKFGASTNYAPIPALSSPAQILQTAGKTNGSESSQLSIGMKLADNLESGNYTNKLILSFISNPYQMRAMMTEGPDFNAKLKDLETATSKIEHFKKSTVAPAISMNAVSIEDEESDYEIKIWFDLANNTAYYYTDSEKIILNSDCQGMFMRFTKMKELDLRGFDSSLVKNMHTMFYEMRALESIDLSNFDTRNVRTMYAMFNADVSLENLDVSSFQTNKVTDMKYMFFEMRKLKELNLSNFNTFNVVDMSNMFANMYALTTLNLSSFNTSKVTDMSYMFYNMNKIIDLDLSNFNTQNVTDMGGMFAYVTNLKSLNLANFNTKKVTNMYSMFSSMPSLITLDLSSFDTSNVTNMDGMFYHANSLTSLVLSNFDTSNVVNMQSMFELGDEDTDKDKLTVIYVNNDFNTAKLANFSEMFKNRKKLRGGNGSYLANPSIADKSWLRIDDPTHGRPGYFTRKS